jgi:membrane protein YdbS with pleckstrin-like domain
MTRKRFKSKIDRWLLILLVAIIVFEIIVMMLAALQADNVRDSAALIFAALAVGTLIAWLVLGTHYAVDKDSLRITAGPFRWNVRLDEIRAVEATRNPLSSPALSLDRLMIHYGNGRRIMVSPADKAGFLKAIGQELAGDR